MMRLELATKAYQGARTQQQDAAAALSIDDRKSAVLVLADGLGGHKGGAEAAQFVVDTFRQAAEAGDFTSPARRWQALRQALDAANARIAGGVDPADGHRSMASTAVVAVVAEGMLNWISVGDSHLYLWRRGKLTKLNEDHSQAGLMVRSGQYKEDDPEVQAVKSVLVSALTGRKLEIVDHPTSAYQLESGDVLILASDGLNTLSESETEAIVSGGKDLNAAALSAKLVDTVEERKVDRQDNTTVAVARVIHAPQRAASEARTEISVARVPTPITAPTVIPSAQRRTEAAPARAVERPTDVAASAVTQRIEADPPATQQNPGPQARAASETVRSGPPPAPSQANVRTAALAGAELPSPKPPQKPVPELKATKPMSPPDASQTRSRNPTMALLGIVMFLLAAVLGAVALGKLAGFNVLDSVLGTSKTVAPPVAKEGPPQPQAPAPPAPAPAKATPPLPPPPKQDALPLPAPKAQEPVKAVPPPQVLPPVSAPAPVAPPAPSPRTEQPSAPLQQPRPVEAPRVTPVAPPASSSEPGGGNRGPEGGPAPNGVTPQPAAPRLAPQPQQRAPLPGQQGAVPQAPIRTPQVSPVQPRQQAQHPSAALERQVRCRFHPEFGAVESFQHCSSECVQVYGFTTQANHCTAMCRSICQ